jgi:hypothetical protein
MYNTALHLNYKSNHIYFSKYLDYYLQFNFKIILIHINSNFIDISTFNIKHILNYLNNYTNKKIEILLVLNNSIVYNSNKNYNYNSNINTCLIDIFKNIHIVFKINSNNLLLINNNFRNINNLDIDINDNLYIIQNIYIYNYIFYDTLDIEELSNYDLNLYKNNKLSISNYILNIKLYIDNFSNIIFNKINVENFSKIYNISESNIILLNIEYNDIFDLFFNIFNNIEKEYDLEKLTINKIKSNINDKYIVNFKQRENINIDISKYINCLISLSNFNISIEKLIEEYTNIFNIKFKNNPLINLLLKNLNYYYTNNLIQNKSNKHIAVSNNIFIKYYFELYKSNAKIQKYNDLINNILSYKNKYNLLYTNYKQKLNIFKIDNNNKILNIFKNINENTCKSYINNIYFKHIHYLRKYHDKYLNIYDELILNNKNKDKNNKIFNINNYKYTNLDTIDYNNIDTNVIKNIVNFYKNYINLLNKKELNNNIDNDKYLKNKLLYLYYKKIETIII